MPLLAEVSVALPSGIIAVWALPCDYKRVPPQPWRREHKLAYGRFSIRRFSVIPAVLGTRLIRRFSIAAQLRGRATLRQWAKHRFP
jgi:hypothetical protein